MFSLKISSSTLAPTAWQGGSEAGSATTSSKMAKVEAGFVNGTTKCCLDCSGLVSTTFFTSAFWKTFSGTAPLKKQQKIEYRCINKSNIPWNIGKKRNWMV